MNTTKEFEQMQDLLLSIRGRLILMASLDYSQGSLEEQEIRFGIVQVSEDTKSDVEICLSLIDNIFSLS